MEGRGLRREEVDRGSKGSTDRRLYREKELERKEWKKKGHEERERERVRGDNSTAKYR